MKRFLRSFVVTARSALAEATANRKAFMFQVIVMILNDLAWVGFWVVFFQKTGVVRGWDTEQVLLLQAVMTTAGGISLGVFANSRHLSRLIAEGGLDAALGLPIHPLSHLLVRKFEAVSAGDFLFGIALFIFAGHPTVSRAAIFLLGCIASTVVLTSFLVLIASLSFFTGRTDTGDVGFNAILVLSGYPVDLFAGSSKVFLYSVVPAAFVATVPSKLIRQFDLKSALIMSAVAAAFAVTASTTFHTGLRRYASGSIWTRA